MHAPTSPIPPKPKRPALLSRLLGRTVAHGELRLPAVPAMLEDYLALCERTFEALDIRFTQEQSGQLREVLKSQLEIAFSASPRSQIIITYDAPGGKTVNYHVKPLWSSVGSVYDSWVANRQPPFFGTEPDARVLALAKAMAEPSASAVLDIGAGTGRNSLALARRGHPIDAVELSGEFAAILRAEAAKASLPIRVLERDVFASTAGLRRDYRLMVLSEVVSDFRDTSQLRRVFELAADFLAPGGELVFNVFLPVGGYVPDAAARELGQQVFTSLFTREEVETAAADLPLQLVAEDPVYDYEKAHLPEGAWPPTGWYVAWVSGQDLFDVPQQDSPIALRWLVYRKQAP
jgi:SAM-dependent methyltransferase